MQDKKFSNKKKLIAIFVATFFIVLVLIFQIANILSPNVDVEIPDEETGDSVEKEDDVKKMIDERLKWIQFEDNELPAEEKKDDLSPQSDDDFTNENNSENEKKEAPSQKAPEVTKEKIKEEVEAPQKPTPKAPAPTSELHVYKVYIGTFATIEQAISAQDKIIEANIGITPYIKGVDNKFTLQAGSFANKQKAEAQAQMLSQYGIGSRIIEE